MCNLVFRSTLNALRIIHFVLNNLKLLHLDQGGIQKVLAPGNISDLNCIVQQIVLDRIVCFPICIFTRVGCIEKPIFAVSLLLILLRSKSAIIRC